MAQSQAAGRRRFARLATSTAFASLFMAWLEIPRSEATHSPEGKLAYSNGRGVPEMTFTKRRGNRVELRPRAPVGERGKGCARGR